MLREKCRKIVLVILCVLSVTVMSCSNGDPVFHDTTGNPVQLKKMRGKWIIINYWAAWCSGCVREIPELNHFYKSNQDKNVMLYGVNFDQLPLENLKDAMARTDIHFPVIVEDPNAVWHLGEIPVLPATFIINPKGKVVKEIYGTNSEESLNEVLQDLQKNG
ncbi:MAG: TlpA disulfide reductase family protein [Gammaproteobacteria bacterium]|nr:TlpA disulfide reductase family protein [Gammaproteobacteria bacterium]